MRKIAAAALFALIAVAPLAAADSTTILTSSDALHQALAGDDHRAAVQAARSLEAAATAAAKEQSGPTAARLQRLAAAAKAVASSSDLQAARRGFGAVSREIVAIVIASEELQEGHTLYTCPMVEGYGEWVQKAGSTANPYWGSAMLTCGTRKDWR